ncbi:SDR family NAD(P)-dependent oxidoreductase [Streptomyces nanhaiensis]|uniref:SDR family NAD(P)-dependent oxidoreductase n=1 Tax=Streptomyces nanhaiensis TaxID=679319 RepID=UPI00399C5169
MANPYDYCGQVAVVTGASSGIGRAYARELAERGADLILVARTEPALKELAEELGRRHGITARVLPADLAVPTAGQTIADTLADWNVRADILVNNAGFASYGLFADSQTARNADMVQVNIASLVDLTGRLLPGMVDRRRGLIVNIASNTAFQPLPYFALYAATKSFVLSFTEALHAETASSGVRVLALCPGATDTAFFDHASGAERGPKQTVDQVIATAFRAVDRGRPSAVSGLVNRIAAAALPRVLPRRAVLALAHRTMRPRA